MQVFHLADLKVNELNDIFQKSREEPSSDRRLSRILPPSPPPPPRAMSAPVATAKKQAPWKGFVAGSAGAMLSGAVTHPIDLVKVRMQLYGAKDGFEAAAAATSKAG